MSNFVASMMDDAAADKDENGNEIQEIPIPDVGNAVMSKVIEFCMYYKEQTPMIPIEKPLKSSNIEDLVQPSWYVDFMKVEQVLLFELVRASHSMDIPPLLELSCVVVSILIKVSGFFSPVFKAGDRFCFCCFFCGCFHGNTMG